MMIDVTTETESMIEQHLAWALMPADERDALAEALVQIRRARASGTTFLHVLFKDAKYRWPVVRIA